MSYAQHEERAGNTDNVGEVLRRGLLASTAMELWRFYVDFTSRKLLSGVPDGDEEKVLEARAGIQKAFEFALDNVGNSMAVGGLLRAYIDFHKAAPVRGMSAPLMHTPSGAARLTTPPRSLSRRSHPTSSAAQRAKKLWPCAQRTSTPSRGRTRCWRNSGGSTPRTRLSTHRRSWCVACAAAGTLSMRC